MRYLIAFFSSLLMLTAACGEADETTTLFSMSEENIGPVSVGMERGDIAALGFEIETRTIRLEGDDYDQYVVKIGPEAFVSALFLGESVFEVSTSSSAFSTDRGVHVGSSLSDLKTAYPRGRLIRGYADGLYLNFLTDQDGIFEFDADSLGDDCIIENKECGVHLNELRTVRYYVR